MKISEVAKELNVDISTIRFYERKGLVQPKRRADSKYREYSGEDIGELKSIILYRKLDFSIEEIRILMAGEGNLQEMLLLRQEKLRRQQEEIAGSLALCDKMIADQAGEDLDVEYYLSYTRQAEQAGYHFPDIMPTLDLVTKNLQIERFVGFPLAGWILQSDLLRRMVAVLFLGSMVAIPLIVLVISIAECVRGEGSVMKVVVGCVYCIMFFTAVATKVRGEITNESEEES